MTQRCIRWGCNYPPPEKTRLEERRTIQPVGNMDFFWTIFYVLHLFMPGPDQTSLNARAQHEYDVVVYGNTVAALAAAVQTTRMGKTVAIVSPQSHLGGLTTSGLGWTDSKDAKSIGGISREFYERVFRFYQQPDAWTRESRSAYMDRRIWAQPQSWAIDSKNEVQWTFEPSAAEKIWERWMSDGKVPVFRNMTIRRSADGVTKDGARITAITMLDGTVFRGSMFIDASYEGDMMEAAQIPYRVGRESSAEYDESYGGIRVNDLDKPFPFDPYVVKGDPESGLIPTISRVVEDPEAEQGKADAVRLQAYNYRLCLTRNKSNRVAFTKPDNYSVATYEVLLRSIESGYNGGFFTTQLMPNHKTDSNNQNGHVSTDFLGGNFNNNSNYPEWTYAEREASALRHKDWIQGLLWTLVSSPRVPQQTRDNVDKWGYAKDEFVDNDHWPYELYIREGRRMHGLYTMTQNDVQNPDQTFPEDTIVGMGSYTFDVHRVERVVVNHDPFDEGKVHVPNKKSFPIPYGAIVPHADHAVNFLNPVTMSSTHVAFAAIRMEPTYMILGQSAATAAVLALEGGVCVQNVDRGVLAGRLREDGQVGGGEGEGVVAATVDSGAGRMGGGGFFRAVMEMF